MKWTSSGTIDKDIEATREKLELFLPPNDAATFNCAICLKDTCEVVGMGGCHLFPAGHGWPEVGYMLRKEFWGGGLATEFLRAWLRLWGGLPREEREVRAEKAMVTGEGVVPEQVIAITEASNGASQKVLLRVGFQRLREFIEADDSEPDGFVKLVAFRYFPSKRDD
jgi:RimJ/RimL family protein N-acetyltransferase